MTPADHEADTRQRRFLARRRRILDTALRLAEEEGWHAVTTRRLAAAIDYSQPVVYQHFENRDELIRTLVVEGFAALAERVDAVTQSASAEVLEDLARAYIDFGTTRPRLYEAMFTRPTELPFAQSHTPPELRAAFDALADAIAREAPNATEATAELFWACCHGIVTLLSAKRIPPERLDQHVRRVAELARLDGSP